MKRIRDILKVRAVIAMFLIVAMNVAPLSAVTYPNPGKMNVLYQQGFNPGVGCPAGYAANGNLTHQKKANGRYLFILECVRIDVQIFNEMVELVKADLFAELGYDLSKSANPSLTPAEQDAIANVALSLSTAQLDLLRSFGYYHRTPGLDTDNYVVYLVSLTNPRYSGAFVDFVENLSPDPGFNECPSDYALISDPAQEIKISPSRWNTAAGDAIITRDPENKNGAFQFDIGITYSHAGMAESNNSVRHLVAYPDHFVLLKRSLDLWDMVNLAANNAAHFVPGFKAQLDSMEARYDTFSLQNGLPGITSESTANSIVNTTQQKGLMPGYVKGFNEKDAMVLRPADPVTGRPLLVEASKKGSVKESYYNVYAFSNGSYGSGYGVCSTFVRDNLVDAGGPDFMNQPVYPTKSDLLAVGMDPTYVDLIVDQTAPGYVGKIKTGYSSTRKAWKYTPEYKSWGADIAYDFFMKSMITPFYDLFKQKLNEKGMKYSFSKSETAYASYLTRSNLAIQMLNCFTFNECGNQTAPRYSGMDEGFFAVFDTYRPEWPVSSFTKDRPAKEGYAFSPDDLLFVGAPYDRVEQFKHSPAEFVSPATLPMPMRVCAESSLYTDQYTPCRCKAGTNCSSCDLETKNPNRPVENRYWASAYQPLRYTGNVYRSDKRSETFSWNVPVSQTLKVKAEGYQNLKSVIVKKGDKVVIGLATEWADDVQCTRTTTSLTAVLTVNGRRQYFKESCGEKGASAGLYVERWENVQ